LKSNRNSEISGFPEIPGPAQLNIQCRGGKRGEGEREHEGKRESRPVTDM